MKTHTLGSESRQSKIDFYRKKEQCSFSISRRTVTNLVTISGSWMIIVAFEDPTNKNGLKDKANNDEVYTIDVILK